MIHTKSLIRRLAYVPWLLAFGLVLGWAGEAQAQKITLSADKTEVREDGGAVTIKVTAKTFNAKDEHAALGAERVVQLNVTAPYFLINDIGDPIVPTRETGDPNDASPTNGGPTEGFGTRFTMTLPTIVIPKDQKEVSVDITFTPIPTNHENDPAVTTGDNQYKGTDRIVNEDLEIILTGSTGGVVPIADADQPKVITMLDTDKPSKLIRLALSPGKISKEAEETSVSVSGSFDGAVVRNQTLSFLLRQESPGLDGDGEQRPEAQRDEDYDIVMSTLSIARRKPSGSTNISITPKNAGTGFIGISGNKKLEISGTDLNNDGDARDSWTARGAAEDNTGGEAEPPQDYASGDSPTISEIGLAMDFFPDPSVETTVTLTPVRHDHDEDGAGDDGVTGTDEDGEDYTNDNPGTPNIWAYNEADLNGAAGTPEDAVSLDLNGDGDTEDFVTEVKESVVLHALTIVQADFQIDAGAIAASKGLTASPSIVRESLVGQEEGSREVSVELSLEITNKLPDDARVRFFIRDHLPEDADTDKVEAAERGPQYTATVDALTIPAGETKGTTTLNLTVFDNDSQNKDRVFRVEARVGTVPQYAFITIADDETPTTTIALSADPGSVKAETGVQEVTITAELNGNVFEEDAEVILVIVGGDKAATRDTEYEAALRSLTIPAGQVTGSTTVEVEAKAGGDKNVWIGSVKNDPYAKNINDDDILVSPVKVVLKDADAADEADDPGALSFDVDLSSTIYDGSVGAAIDDIELPEATGGEGDRTYSVSNNLPAGLSFDADDLTVSGTPTAAGETTVVYTVIDAEGSAATTFTIEIAPEAPPTVSVESVNVSRTSVREDDVATEITLTAKLAAAAPVAETITFRLDGGTAIRDVDYTATLVGSVDIAEGDTEAQTTLTLTPLDNDEEDGNRIVGLRASASGGSEAAEVTIADDETASTSISLSADPHSVSEDAESVRGQITASLSGKVLDADAVVTVTVDNVASTATRDVDYNISFSPELTIPAGEVSGSIPYLMVLRTDEEDEGSETVALSGAIDALEDGTGTITINDAEAMMEDDMMMDPLAFAEGAMIDAIEATAGTAIAEVVLPEAAGGEGDITYSVSDNLPAGLSFADSTRTLSGTPEAATEEAVEVTYTATAGDETATLTISITVNAALEFDLSDFLGAFNNGAGKANPADSHVAEGAIPIVVGQPYSLTLPAVSGGTPPLTYSVSGLPAGLSFDPATRTVAGTPTEVGDAVVVTYSVTDGSGASSALPILVQVIEPPLGAPTNLVVEDYKGADGQGDQGGFILVTWELSEHHDGIDGYRIFRALPVLGNEMVPWAMVDAVPGVERGVAVVATLDNVATRWGIAAERGGQTTHGDAKAVFVSADNPYELMAETMAASVEAAQAGDAPVFASLLPEAIAYAQGAAPRLNLVAGVLSSAMTVTDEEVRAIDDIAPLAVPSLSVLDAPNDQGSRIALTWTLSPSDQVLQDVLAGAIGPLGTDPIVGVYGYNIYRSAAGEDEFAKIGQVDAGVASFVDETALNGVRYTYQVRPYDLDNETGSDLEQTAMAVRNLVVDSDGRTLFGLFGSDSQIGFDDFFIFADNFGLTAEDTGFDPAFDLAPNAMIDFDDFFVFADNFGRSTAAAGKRVPTFAGLNADARMYLDARTALPSVGEDFVLDVRLADFAAIKGYGLQVQYDASMLEFVQVQTDQPLGGSELATPQVLSNEAGELALVAYGDMVFDGELALSLVFRPTTEIENTVIEITDNQTYDSEFGFNSLALPAPVQVQTRPEAFSLANNYPNPFNPATTIKYALPQAADVELTVYNVVGQPVRTLVAEHQSAGRYVVEWDATNDNGHSLSSGMYFYRLEAGGEFLEVKKMLLLK